VPGKVLKAARLFLSEEEMSVKEVKAKDFISGDQIHLMTAHSTYLFVVTDPATRRGVLSGGVLNDRQLAVQFLCAVSKGAAAGDNNSTLRVGAQAVFIYTEGGRTRYLTTSAVTELSRTSETANRKNIFFLPDSFFRIPSH
jgi:hypothetical protein